MIVPFSHAVNIISTLYVMCNVNELWKDMMPK